MIFRNPAAWIGLAALLVPIAIHLLVRAPAQPITLASLRFVPASPMRALRRRVLNDSGLLALRLALLMLAVAAFANPLVTTAGRTATWNARVFRAVVHDTRVDAAEVARAEQEPAAAGATALGDADLRHSLARAVRWLELQPPGRREIVVVSRLTLGAIDEAAVREIPPQVGLRFVRSHATNAGAAIQTMRATRGAEGRLAIVQPRILLDGARTVASSVASTALPANAIEPTAHGWRAPLLQFEVQGAETNRPALRAALTAALGVGAPVPTDQTRQPIALVIGSTAGGEPVRVEPLSQPWMIAALDCLAADPDVVREARAGRAATRDPLPAPWRALVRDADGDVLVAAASAGDASRTTAPTLFVLARVEATSPLSPAIVRGLLASRLDTQRLVEADVLPIADAQLATWSRPPSKVVTGERDTRTIGSDQVSDRSWFWAAVLTLLGIEAVVRRGRGVRVTADESGTRERAA